MNQSISLKTCPAPASTTAWHIHAESRVVCQKGKNISTENPRLLQKLEEGPLMVSYPKVHNIITPGSKFYINFNPLIYDTVPKQYKFH